MSTTDTIEYTYLDCGTEKTGTWTGDRSEAIAKAVLELSAREMSDGDYLYQASAEEGGGWYVIDPDEMATLGAGYLDEASDHYSIWCAGNGREATTDDLADVLDVVVEWTEEYVSDDGEAHELCAYLALDVTVDAPNLGEGGTTYRAAAMVGALESDWGSIRASGAGVRPYATAWWADASDHETVPSQLKDLVLRAIKEEALKLFNGAVAARESAA